MRIRAARLERGLTQQQLAALCGVTRGAVAQWETDRFVPAAGGAAHLSAVAAALGVPEDALLHGHEAGRPASAKGDEHALLEAYRELSAAGRAEVWEAARRLARATGAAPREREAHPATR